MIRTSDVDFLFTVGESTDYIDFNDVDRKRTTINLDYANAFDEKTKLEAWFSIQLYSVH